MSTIFGIIFYIIIWGILRNHGYVLSLNESLAISFFCVFVVGPAILEWRK